MGDKLLPGRTLDFAEQAFLIPHEAIRCEMLTFSRLLPYLNFEVQPWKAHFVNEWLTKFFIPAVHEHHDLEEHLFFPEYTKLGVIVPDYMVTTTHNLFFFLIYTQDTLLIFTQHSFLIYSDQRS